MDVGCNSSNGWHDIDSTPNHNLDLNLDHNLDLVSKPEKCDVPQMDVGCVFAGGADLDIQF